MTFFIPKLGIVALHCVNLGINPSVFDFYVSAGAGTANRTSARVSAKASEFGLNMIGVVVLVLYLLDQYGVFLLDLIYFGFVGKNIGSESILLICD